MINQHSPLSLFFVIKLVVRRINKTTIMMFILFHNFVLLFLFFINQILKEYIVILLLQGLLFQSCDYFIFIYLLWLGKFIWFSFWDSRVIISNELLNVIELKLNAVVHCYIILIFLELVYSNLFLIGQLTMTIRLPLLP